MTFDHIGLFVPDLEAGRAELAGALGILEFTEEVTDPSLKARIQFGAGHSGIRYELVAPFGDDNPVSGCLAAGKNILNHVGYKVRDLTAGMEALRRQGAIPLGPPKPAVAFRGARVVFFMTRLRFVIEIIEEEAGL